jgi:ABC-type multidrug transport system permease subunit
MKIESGKTSEIIFYVDFSKINLIYAVLESLSSKISEASSEISLDLTQQILKQLESAKQEVYNKRPVLVNLITENQQLTEKVNTIKTQTSTAINAVPIDDFKATATEIKSYILQRVISAQNEINLTKRKVDHLNINESEKKSLNTQLSSVNTYLLNIYNKLEDPNNLQESDYNKILRQVNEIDSKLAQVKTTIEQNVNSMSTILSSSSEKLNELQTSLDKIYNDIESVKVTNATTIVTPVSTNIKPVMPEKTYITYLFPSLIVLVVMFISILLATTLMMMEKHSPAFFRNFITPTRGINFLLAAYFTNIIIVFVQLVIIVAISAYFFKTLVLATLPLTIIILLIITTLFTLVGMMIGQLFVSEETGILAAVSISSIFLFLSNMIIPLESMPDYIKGIASLNPFVLSEVLLRKSILFQATFEKIRTEIGIIIIYVIALSLILMLLYYLEKKHLFHKITYKRYKRMQKRKLISPQKTK